MVLLLLLPLPLPLVAAAVVLTWKSAPIVSQQYLLFPFPHPPSLAFPLSYPTRPPPEKITQHT